MRIIPWRSAALALFLMMVTAAGAGAGQVELLSKADPVPDTYGDSSVLSLSADGRWAVLKSDSPNLAPGQDDANGYFDLFLRDRLTGATTLITHDAGSPNAASPVDVSFSLAEPEARISADGRYVAFSTLSTRLVPGVTEANHSSDVFLHDRVTGATTLISHAAGDPATTANGFSYQAHISADGNWVAFISLATNLVAGQTAGGPETRFNVFLYDRRSGSLSLVSHASGSPAITGDGSSSDPEISADGSWIVFGSVAGKLVAGQTSPGPGINQMFLYQRAAGALTLVSHAAGSPLTGGNNGCGRPRISADGRWVAFTSTARNLVAGQVTGPSPNNAFLYDRVSGEIRLASHTSASPLIAAGSDTSYLGGQIALSADGRYLAFSSADPGVVPGQVNLSTGTQLYVYDRTTGTVSLVSHDRDSQTTTGAAFGSYNPSLSVDGRWIAYESPAPDLAPGQTDAAATFDVFLYDQSSRTNVLVSHTRAGTATAGNGRSGSALLSADGNVVAFDSLATDLAAGRIDPNGFRVSFSYDRRSAEVTPLTPRDPSLPATAPHGPSSTADLSADGRYAVFLSQATGLVPGQVDTPYSVDVYGDRHGSWDVFLRDRATGKNVLLSRSKTAPPTATGGDLAAISADGKVVAFRLLGTGTSLVAYEREGEAYRLVNGAPGAAPPRPDGTPQGRPALSADGRWIAYACAGCHLVAGQQDGQPGFSQAQNVFLHDRLTGANTLVSHASGSATTTGDRESQAPHISADGRFVLFTSGATNLVAGQTGGTDSVNLFLFDRATGAITLVNHTAGAATTAAGGSPYDNALSADGRWVVFRSLATNLVPGQVDTNEVFDVFLYDRATGAISLVSHVPSSAVTTGSGGLDYYSGGEPVGISADGRWIVFTSQETDLVPGGVNPDKLVAVYLHDRTTGQVTLVSSAAGSSNTVRYGIQPGISADGGRITFLSTAADLVPGQTQTGNAVLNLFVQDRATGARALAGRVGGFPNGVSINVSLIPRLSADGRQIAFTSSSKLVEGDLNGDWDAYLYDAAGGTGGPVTLPPCNLFSGALRSNARKVLTVAGACGVPAGAKQVLLKLAVSKGTGKGNVQVYPGNVTSPSSGILRFNQGMARSADFTVSLGNDGIALLPFVAGNGTVRVRVEVDGYVPQKGLQGQQGHQGRQEKRLPSQEGPWSPCCLCWPWSPFFF